MPGQHIVGPTSHYYYSQRLKLHYVDWGNHDKPLLVLIHGGRDHARNWDWVAQTLRDDYHVIAPDLRGHGDSEWARGSEYSMREANPRLSKEQASHLTLYGTTRNEDGTYTWKFDNYVRAQSPYRFNVDDAWEIWGRITCPTLLIRGSESWASDPEKDGRAGAF